MVTITKGHLRFIYISTSLNNALVLQSGTLVNRDMAEEIGKGVTISINWGEMTDDNNLRRDHRGGWAIGEGM